MLITAFLLLELILLAKAAQWIMQPRQSFKIKFASNSLMQLAFISMPEIHMLSVLSASNLHSKRVYGGAGD